MPKTEGAPLRSIPLAKGIPDMMGMTMWRGRLHVPAALALLVTLVPAFLPGCSGPTYSQAIHIGVEQVNVGGIMARVEYYRSGELVNSVNLIDGNGDGVIDGKSGPAQPGNWPKGWEWFDDLYADVSVGHSTIALTEDKVTVQDGTTYEFITGEYECERVG